MYEDLLNICTILANSVIFATLNETGSVESHIEKAVDDILLIINDD